MKTNSVKILSFADRVEWQSLLTRFRISDTYFTAEYLKTNESLMGGVAECFVFESSDKIIAYPYIKRPIEGTSFFDISTPYGFGGYLSNIDQITRDFDEEFALYCSESGIVSEFVRFHPLLENHRLAECSSLQVSYHQPVVHVDFTKQNFELRKTIKKEVIKKLKKASNNRIEVLVDAQFNFYRNFVDMYHETMDFKKAAQFYFFGEGFFSDLRNYLSDRMLLLICIYNEKIIGGLLILFDEKYAYNFLSCSKRDYLSLGTNDMLQFSALEWAYNTGKTKYLLGGGLKGEDSLFQYKTRFSPDRTGFYIGKRVHLSDQYNALCEQARTRQIAGKEEFYTRSWFPLYRSDTINTGWRENNDRKCK